LSQKEFPVRDVVHGSKPFHSLPIVRSIVLLTMIITGVQSGEVIMMVFWCN